MSPAAYTPGTLGDLGAVVANHGAHRRVVDSQPGHPARREHGHVLTPAARERGLALGHLAVPTLRLAGSAQ
jgi:hypothetical protein